MILLQRLCAKVGSDGIVPEGVDHFAATRRHAAAFCSQTLQSAYGMRLIGAKRLRMRGRNVRCLTTGTSAALHT